MARLSYARAGRLTLSVFKAIAAWHVITRYVVTSTSVEGASMLPTVDIMGQWVVVSSLHRHGRGVKVGDLVTYDIPVSRETCGLKRVIGMPGDYVALQAPMAPKGVGDDMMQVCCLSHPSLLLRPPCLRTAAVWTVVLGALWGPPAYTSLPQVPPGHCWLVGDNLTISRDSRDFGPVPLGLIRGKALMLLWPFKRLDSGLTKVE